MTVIDSNPPIPPKETAFTEDGLYDLFRTQTMGGIRYTNKHDRVLLVDARSSNYTDHVDLEKGTVIYTGTGEEPQSFEGRVGRFNERVRSPKSVLLYFHKPYANYLVFKFRVKYLSHYMSSEENKAGKMRRVIKFKLKILDI